jgi:hypothetical protein
LTNWLGNNSLSALSKSARSFTVPVVVSIWLSTVASVPVASWVVLLRSNATTGSFAPAASRFITCGTSSSGSVKITEIGCSCVSTTSPLVSLVCT